MSQIQFKISQVQIKISQVQIKIDQVQFKIDKLKLKIYIKNVYIAADYIAQWKEQLHN